MPQRRPDPPDVPTNDVRTTVVGTVLWAVALLACLVFRDRLDEAGRGWWIGTCAGGLALGVVGIVYTRRRNAAIARDEASRISHN